MVAVAYYKNRSVGISIKQLRKEKQNPNLNKTACPEKVV